jgi:hypothetical protein
MTSKKYWCPTCGDLESHHWFGGVYIVSHKHPCESKREIPIVVPLDVPEVTTWGESGGAGEVCLDDGIHQMGRGRGKGRNERWALQRNHDPDRWFVAHGRHDFDADAVIAINHVVGVRNVAGVLK